MKTRTLALLLTGLFLTTLPLAAQTNAPAVLFPDEDPLTPELLKLVWPATPGLRYEVQQSTNLQSWSTAPGYPATANGPAQQMPFLTSGDARFFQVKELDEQPPGIASQYPQDGGFAVPRFANITMLLADATGINTNSIQFTVGSLGTFTVNGTNLTYTNGLLTFINGGSVPLGGWGSNITASLIMADTLGYWATNTFSFDLEVQPQVVSNLFVFGSSQALRSGQQLRPSPTVALAQRSGPIPMGAGDPWTLELVASNRLELSYTNVAPGFAVNELYISNKTPASTNEIFYRRITSVSDNPAAKRLTLYTVDVPLAEILQEGSATLTPDSVIYQVTNGVIVRALAFNHTIQFDSVGLNVVDKELYHQAAVTLTLKEAKCLFTPTLDLSFETKFLSLQRFKATLRGRFEAAVVPELQLGGVLQDDRQFDLYQHQWLVYVGQAGPVPVWLDFNFNLQAQLGYNVTADATLTLGARKNMDLAFGVDYVKGRSPALQGNPTVTPYPTETLFSYTLNGSATAYAKLVPQLDVRVNSLAGLYASLDPRVELTGNATASNGQVTTADLSLLAAADLNVGFSVVGLGSLDPLATFNLFSYPWSVSYPPPPTISIRHQPQGVTATVGDTVSFTVDAVYSQPLSYQWFYGYVPLAGKTSPTMVLLNVTNSHVGPYSVRVSSGSLTTNSAEAWLSVIPKINPTNMALIPAGSFTMGATTNMGHESYSDEVPQHTVYVSAFYMDKYEVTKSLWDEVKAYNGGNGYGYGSGSGLGKAVNHPVHTVNWFDAVKWCNARSQKEGKTPCYYTDAGLTTIYKTGQVAPYVNWSASGYRLPSEAEWEKAARGGASGQRFPWGNTISLSQANYYAYPSGYSYDVNPTEGSHPTFATNSTPYTSPAGYFAPNGYGLYDMAGNVWEWCWDWYGSYSSGSQTDPRGPTSGFDRVLRGGCWGTYAFHCRMAYRGNYCYDPTCRSYVVGFRCARAAGQ